MRENLIVSTADKDPRPRKRSPSSAPVCALGHLPPLGGRLSGRRGVGPYDRSEKAFGGRAMEGPYEKLTRSGAFFCPEHSTRAMRAACPERGLGPHPPKCADEQCSALQGTCPPCGARKTLRTYALPRVFRPLRKLRPRFIRYRRRETAIPFAGFGRGPPQKGNESRQHPLATAADVVYTGFIHLV